MNTISKKDIITEDCSINNYTIYENYVNVKDFGAIGNGQVDDTKAFKDALLSGYNVFIPEGNFMINEPLYVNVNLQWIRGQSFKSRICTMESFSEDDYVLTFYSPNGDYSTRGSRGRVHGNFSIQGCIKQGIRIYNGVRIGGVLNTDREGHVECQVFQNIRVFGCNVAFEYGSHVYKNLFENCEVSDCIYSVMSSSGQYDSGEAILFLSCAFWSGCIKLSSSANFISCTIHLMCKQYVNQLECVHYIKNSNVNFTNCHFEGIAQQIDQTEPYKNVFYVLNSNVTFLNCEGVITGSYYYIAESFFNCQSTSGNGRPSVLKVQGGEWKYLLGRLKVFESDSSTTSVAKGNVNLENIPWKYEFDSMNIHLNIYESHNLFNNSFINKDDFIYMGGIAESDTKEITTVNGIVNFKVIRSRKLENTFGIYKIIKIEGKAAVRYKIDIDMKSNMNYMLSTNHNNVIYRSLYFLDKEKNIINSVINREYTYTKEKLSSEEITNYSLYQTFGIPEYTEYILYGVGGTGIVQQDIEFSLNELFVELI